MEAVLGLRRRQASGAELPEQQRLQLATSGGGEDGAGHGFAAIGSRARSSPFGGSGGSPSDMQCPATHARQLAAAPNIPSLRQQLQHGTRVGAASRAAM